MYQSVETFLERYQELANSAIAYLEALTDESLTQPIADGHRTLGRVAWHLAQSIPEMMSRTGLSPAGPGEEDPVPAAAGAILAAYREASASLLEQVQGRWNDDTLEVADEMYGAQWKRGYTLWILVIHELHHLGQLSVLMRQAGLKVPGVFGPSKEDWAKVGMEPPTI